MPTPSPTTANLPPPPHPEPLRIGHTSTAMTFFHDAATFISDSLKDSAGTCVLLHDDEEARVTIAHTHKRMPAYLQVRRSESAYRRHLAIMGFCDGLSEQFREDLVEMCSEFRRTVGFEDDDAFIELAQAFNAVGRLRYPLIRERHFEKRLAISCPPTDEQWRWVVKNIEHDSGPALQYHRKAVLECHGDPTNRIKIFRSNQPHSTSGKIYEYILLNGPCRLTELRYGFDATPDSVASIVASLYGKGWLRRAEQGTYEVVKYHDELPLPLSVRRQDPHAEGKRKRNHSRKETRARKKRRQVKQQRSRRRDIEREEQQPDL